MAGPFEAVTVGKSQTFGTYDVTREEIIAFAEQYDPQPFHTDPEAARESTAGELVASGWHTAAMTMRLLVDNYLADSGAMGSPASTNSGGTSRSGPATNSPSRRNTSGKRCGTTTAAWSARR